MEPVGGSVLSRLIGDYPEIAAILLIVAGLVLARIARFLTVRALTLLNRSSARLSGRGDLLSDRVIRILGGLGFWTVIAIGVLLALRTLGTGRVFTWIDIPLAYLPRFFVGAVIIGAGYVIGVLVANLVARMQGAGPRTSVMPRVVQAAIVLMGAMTGLQHMGLNVSFVAELLILVVGVCLAGLSLAFALGARQYVANLVARSAVARFAPGDRIRIDHQDGIEGTIVEIHRTGVDLTTAEGVVTVPAWLFNECAVLRRDDSPSQNADV
ncbi:MAG TPA: hypothetical protein VLA56_15600 [Pseudomonadales bacterium]|nr:hypothetical protein [Pseudomonadales bacterium]